MILPNIQNILFSTDLTRSARQAYDYALSVAGRFGASITILYVMEESSHPDSDRLKDFLGEERWQGVRESHEEHARQVLIGKRREAAAIRDALNEFTEAATKDAHKIHSVEADIVVTRGNIVDEIITEAQSRNCDLIVMGYHVRGKPGETMLGSTTRRLLRHTDIPVMMVRMDEE